jgi:AraC-like DNA-binding protein
MDPLRHIFPLLRIDPRRPARLDTGGTWALRFPGSPHVRFGAAVAGMSWLTVAGQQHPLKLESGDGYLLTRGQAYTVGSDPDMPGEDGFALFRQQGGHVQYGSARSVSLVSGRFTFDELSSELLLQVLPPIVHLKPADDSAVVLRAAIDLLDYETREQRLGASLVTHHVAQIMLVQALRMVAASEIARPMGWLAALADPRIGAALQLMHEQIDRRWTVHELAKVAGMSRSVFARRFKQLVGSAPLDYLLHLRMRVAGNALRSGRGNVSAVALEIGYRSESAFSTAFKRIMGAPPKDFRAAES